MQKVTGACERCGRMMQYDMELDKYGRHVVVGRTVSDHICDWWVWSDDLHTPYRYRVHVAGNVIELVARDFVESIKSQSKILLWPMQCKVHLKGIYGDGKSHEIVIVTNDISDDEANDASCHQEEEIVSKDWPEAIGDDTCPQYLCWSKKYGYDIEDARLVHAKDGQEAADVFIRWMTRDDDHEELAEHNEEIPVNVISIDSKAVVTLKAEHTINYKVCI
jgi:hypothetical protein